MSYRLELCAFPASDITYLTHIVYPYLSRIIANCHMEPWWGPWHPIECRSALHHGSSCGYLCILLKQIHHYWPPVQSPMTLQWETNQHKTQYRNHFCAHARYSATSCIISVQWPTSYRLPCKMTNHGNLCESGSAEAVTVGRWWGCLLLRGCAQ
jgi:hypothetical protein